MAEGSSFDPVAYVRALRRAGMYVEPFHEKRTFFVGNPRGMGEPYSRVCRRFRSAFKADRAASIQSVYEALCHEARSVRLEKQ